MLPAVASLWIVLVKVVPRLYGCQQLSCYIPSVLADKWKTKHDWFVTLPRVSSICISRIRCPEEVQLQQRFCPPCPGFSISHSPTNFSPTITNTCKENEISVTCSNKIAISRRIKCKTFSQIVCLSILAFLCDKYNWSWRLLSSQDSQKSMANFSGSFHCFVFTNLISLSLSFITRLKHFLTTFQYHISCFLSHPLAMIIK